MIMSEQTKPDEPVEALAASAATEQVPDWLGARLKRMFTDVMDEPVPDEFKQLMVSRHNPAVMPIQGPGRISSPT